MLQRTLLTYTLWCRWF